MKRLLFLLLFLAASLTPPALSAQAYKTPDVVISTNKVNIGGKVYYVHKVLPKQTVFAICKAYGIKNEELLEANPDLKDGLKAGSIIFIPVDAAKIPSETAHSSAAKTRPVAEKTVAAEPEPDTTASRPVVERVVEHRVRWFDTFSGIAKKYGVSEDVLRDYNGLKPFEPIRGKVLLIPFLGEDAEGAFATADIVENVPAGKTEISEPKDPEP
ncbi:MAG: LysM peptidoglycan-binding domain-containing protein, partial [Bacteroidales bacterium]|nr:LysM peptidoglycan-binding domain-containing protein [Bacteroidales bacterium]